jgi:hypothetical protein
MNPYVKAVKPLTDNRIELEFENGEVRIFDLTPYLKRGIFARLANPSVFNSARVIAGSVEWQGELDLSYDTLYLESYPVQAESVGAESVRER